MAAPAGIQTSEQFGAPSVKLNPAPAGLLSGEIFGAPTVTRGAATIAPAGIPSAEIIGAAKVPGGTQAIRPAGIGSAEWFGSPNPTVTTVFMIPGYGDWTAWIGWTGITSLTFQLQGKITAGNTDVAISYNNFGFDNLLTAFGPAVVSTDQLTSLLNAVTTLDTALHATPGPKVVYGHSLGAMVATLWLHNIGPTSTIPPNELSFVLIGNSFRRYGGLLYATQYGVPVGTPYKVLDIANQYDFFADQPNVVTSPNYLMALTSVLQGGPWVHVFYFNVDPTDTTMPTFVEGNVTYRLAPTLPWWEPAYALPLIESAYNRPEVISGALAGTPPPVPPTPVAVNTPAKRYPAGPITPHGAYHLLAGDTPTVKLTAYDNSIVFSMMGGESIPDRTMPESVQIKGLKGLVPPWKQIKQKGATQDGATFVTSLYDPCEIEMIAVARGRDPQHTRQVSRDLTASIDAIQTSQLSWFTQELGYWWSDIRWGAPPGDPLEGVHTNRQTHSLKLTGFDAFWRSFDYASQFSFSKYVTVTDDFQVPFAHGLGSNWTIITQGFPGVGFLFTDGIAATWSPDTSGHFYPAVASTTICQYNGFSSTTDNQVVSITFTTFAGSYWANNSFNDIWARMGGATGTNGIRVRIGAGTLTLSYFKAGVETVLRQQPLIIPPLPGDTWTLIAGAPVINTLGVTVVDPRAYTVLRNGSSQMTVEEIGTGSQIGAAFRGAGFGIYAGQGLFNQSTPAAVGVFAAGDNTTVTQSGFIQAINGGDQPMWERFTCYGPGIFNIGDGPNATEFVQFGPLLPNQVAQIRSDPRKTGVVDLSSKPPLQQDLNFWEQAVKDFISFATGGNVSVQLQQLESLFGIQPPQGNLYSLLSGRFSIPVPARSPGFPLQAYQIPVSITGGNAASAIVGAGTPLRRLPY